MKKSDQKYWVIGAIAAIVVIAGIIGAVNEANEPVVDIADHFKGSSEAEIVLTEYSDFQCPACKSYAPFVAELATEFSADLKVVYRHFPLNSHPNAKPAAYAAEAAGMQGKFWEMHDAIFEHQAEWSRQSRSQAADTFEGYAKELGLDMGKYANDVKSKSVKVKVDKDIDAANALKVNSTPSFFLNGKRIQNPRSYNEFKQVIEAAQANPVS